MPSRSFLSRIWINLVPKRLLHLIDAEEGYISRFVDEIPICKESAAEFLDIGAGDCRFRELIMDKGYDYKSLDFPNSNTDEIYDFVPENGTFPIQDSRFTYILCIQVLEHVDNPFLFLEEVARILKPGGTIYLTTNFIFPLHYSPKDGFRFTIDAINSLAISVGLNVLDMKKRGGFFALVAKVTLEAPEIFLNWILHPDRILYSMVENEQVFSVNKWKFIFLPIALLMKLLVSLLALTLSILDRVIVTHRYTLGYQCIFTKTQM